MLSLSFGLAVVVGILVGIIVGLAAARCHEKWQTILSCASMGILLGFLIGMSASPIVAVVLTAGFALASALLTKLFDHNTNSHIAEKETTETHTTESRNADSKSRNTVTTKTTVFRPHPESPTLKLNSGWAVSLAAGIVLGVISGTIVWANRLLSLTDSSLPMRLTQLGFDKDQTRKVMDNIVQRMSLADVDRLANEPAPWIAAANTTAENRSPSPKSAPSPPFNWSGFWREIGEVEDESTASKVLDSLQTNNELSEPLRQFVAASRVNPSALETLRHLRAITTKESP